jgi:uncharacterized protein (TIGR03437 family)
MTLWAAVRFRFLGIALCLLLFGETPWAWGQTPAGAALRFDGSNDLVTFGTVSPVTTHTIEAWIKLDRPVTYGAVAGQIAGPGQACGLGMYLRTEASSICYVVDVNGCGNGASLCGPLQVGEWTHVAGSYDGSNMRLYVNGILAAEQGNVPFNPSNFMSAGAVVFFNGPQQYFPGELDELRLWNVARSGSQITANMVRPLMGSEPGLIGYWNFDEGSGQQVADLSPSGVTGLLGRNNTAENSDPAWVESTAPLGPSLNGAVSAASFEGNAIAPGQIVSLFGLGLAKGSAVAGVLPLPEELGGTRVSVIDSAGDPREAQFFFVSPRQINMFVPSETALGNAVVVVRPAESDEGTLGVNVVAVAPGLFTANASGKGVAAASALRVLADGSRSTTPVFQLDAPTKTFVPAPIDVSAPGEQVYLLLYGTGIRGASNLPAVLVGGEVVNVLGAGPQGEFIGLDQVNIGPIPARLAGRGEVNILLFANGVQANPVSVSIR